MKKLNWVTVNKRFLALAIALAMCTLLFQVNHYAGAEESKTESKWKQESTMPTAKRLLRGAFSSEGKIYLFEGLTKNVITQDAISKKVDIYDTKTKTWSNGAEIPAARYGYNYAKVGNKVYAMGGEILDKNFTKSKDVYVYDISNDTWSTATAMPTACACGNTVTIGDKIYVVGGFTADASNCVQIYDTKTDSWAQKAMPSMQASATYQVYNGKIYIIGGEYWTTTDVAIDTVNIYDTVNNSWSTGKAMPHKGTAPASVLKDNKIYVMGGYDTESKKVLDNVQIYDIETNSWSEGPSLTSTRGGSIASLIDDTIYLFGGFDGKEGGISSAPMNNVEVLNLNPVKTQLSILMYEGEKQQLSVSYNLPDNKDYTWVSTDKAVVTVDENGVATAIGEGNTEVTVTDADGNYTETIPIKVLNMQKLAAHISVGGTVRLYLTDDASSVKWKSSNNDFAKVDETGLVTGVSKGLVAITAELDGKEYQLYVRVTEK